MVLRPCLFVFFAGAGVRARPNLRWRIGKTDGKTVSPGVFPGFFDSTSSLGVSGACSPQAVPRASEYGAFCLRGHVPQSRPQNTARCKNQREALVPTYTAPEPGPLGRFSNLPLPLVGQKGTYPGSANLPGNRPGGIYAAPTACRIHYPAAAQSLAMSSL